MESVSLTLGRQENATNHKRPSENERDGHSREAESGWPRKRPYRHGDPILRSRHGAFDLAVTAHGDLDVDQHHTVEDVGITLGEAVQKALGTKRGILRTGYFLMPMDETLAAAAIDLGGRPYCVVNAKISANRVGDFQVELMEDFFQGFAQSAKANVHLRALYGRSSHHQVEAIFKAFARALRFAVSRDKRLRKVLPTTKGLL
jgi:imidazoleglycerol-phosphate dehydratase